MGIRYLNRHLRSTCSTSITKINLKELSNKVIVIDKNTMSSRNKLLSSSGLIFIKQEQYIAFDIQNVRGVYKRSDYLKFVVLMVISETSDEYHMIYVNIEDVYNMFFTPLTTAEEPTNEEMDDEETVDDIYVVDNVDEVD